MYNPTTTDYKILENKTKNLSIECFVLNSNFKTVDKFDGSIINGSMSIDKTANNRRKASMEVFIKDSSYNITSDSKIWMNKYIKIFIGYEYMRTREMIWYPLGIFLYNSVTTTYSSTARTLSLDCSDLMSRLDGTMNGELSALVTKIPQGSIMRDVFISVLTQLGGITSYNISEMGTYYGLIGTDAEIAAYRTANPDWNQIPYDLEYDASNTVFDILSEILNLYQGWEMYFDENGVFQVHMIPTNENDKVVIEKEILDGLIASDGGIQDQNDMVSVKNAVHIWGKVFECDRYSETVTMVGAQYNVTLSSYTGYSTGDVLGFKASATNLANPTAKFGDATVLPIVDESSGNAIPAGTLESGEVYVVKYKSNKLYLLGQYQVEALAILCSAEPSEAQKAIWKSQFNNCKNVKYVINPLSPFTFEKLGELRPKSYSGGDYDDITSNSNALATAQYRLYQLTCWNDIVSFTSLLIPWLTNGNQKIELTVAEEVREYITQQVSFDFSSKTMNVSANRFYPLYSSYITT